MCIMDFIVNLITVKVAGSKKVVYLKDIFFHYLTEQLVIDLLFIVIVSAGLAQATRIVSYFKMLILAKIPWCL